jgi:hypothetical protein
MIIDGTDQDLRELSLGMSVPYTQIQHTHIENEERGYGSDSDNLKQDICSEQQEEIQAPQNSPTSCPGTHLPTWTNEQEDQYFKTDSPVTYSVLVDMPRDIVYDERTRYNCEQDK